MPSPLPIFRDLTDADMKRVARVRKRIIERSSETSPFDTSLDEKTKKLQIAEVLEQRRLAQPGGKTALKAERDAAARMANERKTSKLPGMKYEDESRTRVLEARAKSLEKMATKAERKAKSRARRPKGNPGGSHRLLEGKPGPHPEMRSIIDIRRRNNRS